MHLVKFGFALPAAAGIEAFGVGTVYVAVSVIVDAVEADFLSTKNGEGA